MLTPKSVSFFCALAGVLLTLGCPADAGVITVDGLLGDWGSNQSYSTSTWSSGMTGSVPGFTYTKFVEDLNDTNSDGGFLGPNYGGQNYDAEFIGVGVENGQLKIVIVSGQRRDNIVSNPNTTPAATLLTEMKQRFSPGDIRIETANGVYGVEVGGGVGGTGSASVNKGDPGTTYNLLSNGLTNATTPTLTTAANHTAGSVWKGATWITDPINSTTSTNLAGSPGYYGNEPVQQMSSGPSGGALAGYASNYIFRMDSTLGQHSVIELSIDFEHVFGSNTINRIQWAPSCGNDFAFVNTAIHMPEPSTFVMGALGIASIAGFKWKQSRRSAV